MDSLADPGGDPAGFFGGDTALVPRAALELLQLKDLAMDSVVEGITIADAALPDMPLIYANRAFARITGYSVADTLGKNCRFLQGPGTDPEEVAVLRGAVKGGRPCVVQLLNYRKNGEVTGRRGEEINRCLRPPPSPASLLGARNVWAGLRVTRR